LTLSTTRSAIHSSAAIACFFFQAEDGIRGFHVTGVQTCALPISAPQAHAVALGLPRAGPAPGNRAPRRAPVGLGGPAHLLAQPRSEERRVGKECCSLVQSAPLFARFWLAHSGRVEERVCVIYHLM